MIKAGFVSIALLASIASGSAQDLKCDVGPIKKIFGGATWLIYACNDGVSIAMVTPSDSKAFPFYFGVHVQPDKIDIYGEGTGNKVITDKAAKELQTLKLSEFRSLRQEALAAAKRQR